MCGDGKELASASSTADPRGGRALEIREQHVPEEEMVSPSRAKCPTDPTA